MSVEALGRPPYDSVVDGFEDLRLFRWGGRLFATASSRRYNSRVVPRQVLLEMSNDGVPFRVVPIEYGSPEVCEKNWMPVLGTDEMMFVYGCDPFSVISVDLETGAVREVKKKKYQMCMEGWNGGSQVVQHGDGWVFVVHERAVYPDGRRVYWHRMVYMDKSLELKMFIRPFYFSRVGIEFCAGMAHFNGCFLMSFGVDDRNAGFCMVPYGDLDAAWVGIK
jgi:hypothetical protein